MKQCLSCQARVPDDALVCPKCHASRFIVENSDLEEPCVLSHLNLIEDPQLAGKPVIVEAVVASTSIAYLGPTEVAAAFEEKDGSASTTTIEIGEKDPENLKLVGCNEDVKYRRLKRLFGSIRNIVIRERAWRTIYRVRVRPPVFTLEKRGEKIIDERGYEYKSFDIYVASDKPINFQPSSLIRVEGVCLPAPGTQKTTILVYKVVFPEAVGSFDIDALNRLKNKFEGWTVKQRLNWVLDNFERFSQIVGRRNLAEATFLAFFTPELCRFNGEVQKGWGNCNLTGDTTTGKSETLRKMIMLLKAGILITAETASAVGLTGTATQIEREGWFVEWGFLVLSDRKLLAIDGTHKLSSSNWAALAEAERSGIVTIAKAAKSSAYARTRQVKISNAVDQEADKYTTKSLASFLYACQALATVFDKTSIARLDLAAFADARDVKPEEVNREFAGEYDLDLELLNEALKWCWTGSAEVKFTAEAVETLLNEATNLYNTFNSQAIPLISIDMKWKLARLSTALAFLTLSTGDFRILTVTADHVNEVVQFLKDEYSKAGLNTLAQEDKFEVVTLEEVRLIENRIIEVTKGALDEGEIQKIFKFIVLQGRVTKDQLMTNFSLPEKNVLRPLLAILSNEKLIKSGRGLYPTPKLVQVYKALLTTLATFITVEKEPLENKSSQQKKVEGFLPDHGKHGKCGKKEADQAKANVVPIGFVGIHLNSVLDHLQPMKYEHVGECGNCHEKPTRLTHTVRTSDGQTFMVCKLCAKELTKTLEAKKE